MAGFVFKETEEFVYSKKQKSNQEKRRWFTSTLSSLQVHVPEMNYHDISIKEYSEQWIQPGWTLQDQ